MIVLPSAAGTSLTAIEGGLTAVSVALAFSWPQIGSPFFRSVERWLEAVGRRKGRAVASVGVGALLLRILLLPLCPVPLPFAPGDFSFVLAADTFASARLTNPTPPMWVHFESIHITMQPSYMSMYFPAQGLLLAAGKVLLGNAWAAVLISDALMCAAICWMLQAWLPPAWALLGGWIAVLHLGLFSYWVNTYHAGGCIAAIAGSLALGSLPRLTHTARVRYAALLGLGIGILVLCRPFDCLLLCLPVAGALLHWSIAGRDRPSVPQLARLSVAPLAIVISAVAWLGYYDHRVFGNALTLPYTVDRAEYASVPYFVWQPERPAPAYRHAEMRRFYEHDELAGYEFHRLQGPSHYIGQTLAKALRSLLFFAGAALLPPLIMARRVLMDRRVRFLVVCIAVLAAGMAIEVFLVPHYMAAFTGALYALGLQAMRHLRVWKPEGRPVGLAMTRLCVAVCLLMVALFSAFAGPLHLALPRSGRPMSGTSAGTALGILARSVRPSRRSSNNFPAPSWPSCATRRTTTPPTSGCTTPPTSTRKKSSGPAPWTPPATPNCSITMPTVIPGSSCPIGRTHRWFPISCNLDRLRGR